MTLQLWDKYKMYAVNLYGGPQLPKLRITRQINGSINKNSIKNNLFASAFIVTSAEEVIFSHMFIYLLVLSQNYTKTIWPFPQNLVGVWVSAQNGLH